VTPRGAPLPSFTVQVVGSPTPVPAGFQYAFVALPLGRVILPDSVNDFALRLRERAAARGVRAITTTELAPAQTILDSIQLNAFDLLVTRRISCELRGRYAVEGSARFTFSGSRAEWYSYGFEPQLTVVYRQCLAAGADAILDQLGYSGNSKNDTATRRRSGTDTW
jgi:hypothetical protein